MQPNQPSRFFLLVGALITFTAIVGFFVGLQSPMNPFEKTARVQGLSRGVGIRKFEQMEVGSIPATDYSQMGMAVRTNVTPPTHAHPESPLFGVDKPNSDLPLPIESIRQYPIDAQAAMEVQVDNKIPIAEKRFALAMREKNRAYNGAPPTVPHPIVEMSAESCVACHSQGTQTATLRIPRMSHPFLSNCTQCHVGIAPAEMPNAMVRANHFVGLAAPEGGPKAYAGAPPQIPHTTWMRVDCLSCHGQASYRGLQTTHPWRQNCQQCHAPSSTGEQTILESNAKFLAPLPIDSF